MVLEKLAEQAYSEYAPAAVGTAVGAGMGAGASYIAGRQNMKKELIGNPDAPAMTKAQAKKIEDVAGKTRVKKGKGAMIGAATGLGAGLAAKAMNKKPAMEEIYVQAAVEFAGLSKVAEELEMAYENLEARAEDIAQNLVLQAGASRGLTGAALHQFATTTMEAVKDFAAKQEITLAEAANAYLLGEVEDEVPANPAGPVVPEGQPAPEEMTEEEYIEAAASAYASELLEKIAAQINEDN